MKSSSEATEESLGFSDTIQDYDLRHEIGIGSFGRVYEGEDRTTGRLCAVKKISKTNHPNPGKLQSEVEIQKRASAHENIVRLFRAIEDETNVYLIMELCSGGSLKSLIRSALESPHKKSPEKRSPCSGYGSFRRSSSTSSIKSPSGLGTEFTRSHHPVLPYDVIRSIIRQVCRGLDYLHRNGIVHRDVNVNNLLVKSRVSLNSSRCARDIRIMIADFGLALDLQNVKNNQVLQSHNLVGNTICGTPGFISPEVWKQSTPVTPASDVFSLGSIIYAMVTGVTSPKGDLDVSTFPPLLASLVSSLLHDDPDCRLSVKDILDHPFVLGPLCLKRLEPTTVTAKHHSFTIHEDFSVSLTFLEKDCGIKVSANFSEITIKTRQSVKKYSLENLPKTRWKWLSRIHDFIHGIRSSTPKIKKFCPLNTQSQHKVSSIDSKGKRLTILGGILSEAGTFKAFVVDDLTGVHQKVHLSDDLQEANPILFRQVKDLYETCLKMEDSLELLAENQDEELFPITCGKNPIKEKEKQRNNLSMTMTKCVTIDDVSSASKVRDGFQVTFRDGSSLTYFTNSEISYKSSPHKPPSLYKAASYLPPIVQHKLAIIPALINSKSQQRVRPGLSHMSC